VLKALTSGLDKNPETLRPVVEDLGEIVKSLKDRHWKGGQSEREVG
jgi:hypothetical protein